MRLRRRKPPAEATEEAALPENLTYVRFAHFAADAPALDIFVDGELSDIQQLAFPAITGWVEMPAGTYEFALAPIDTSYAEAVVGPFNYTLNANAFSTLAVVGSAEAGTLTIQVLRLDYTLPPEGQARVAVFHAIPDAESVDVITSDGTVLVSGLNFATQADFNSGLAEFDVDAGTYDLRVVPSGATEPTFLDLSGTTLEADTFYFIVATGTANSARVFIDSISRSDLIAGTNLGAPNAAATAEATAEVDDALATEEPDMAATEEPEIVGTEEASM